MVFCSGASWKAEVESSWLLSVLWTLGSVAMVEVASMLSYASDVHCCVARLERQDGPRAMLTELEDCVSLVFPPSAAERPEMTKPLEKLRLPKSRLSVELEEDT